ncbi:MAG: TauD/TfdA dioxygenase family protein [Myxococcota bacterium]
MSAAIEVRPVTPVVGAEIGGVDLREPLPDAQIGAIRDALHAHLVLFFRDQDVTPDQQIAFARQFGEISVPPFAPKYGSDPELVVLDQVSPKGEGADNWHSDNTFMAEPPMGSILKAVQLPALGGDTCFASMYAAYEALSEPIRRLVDGLEAVHDLTRPLQKAIDAGHSNANLAEVQAKWPPVTHPVVRTHPVTGRKALFVNGNSTTRLVGLSERENALLLPFLNDHVRDPAFQCRFRWDTNSIAFWDNRSAQHYAVPDYGERRVMHRVTLAGDRPR